MTVQTWHWMEAYIALRYWNHFLTRPFDGCFCLGRSTILPTTHSTLHSIIEVLKYRRDEFTECINQFRLYHITETTGIIIGSTIQET
jgi:hypothetical protein